MDPAFAPMDFVPCDDDVSYFHTEACNICYTTSVAGRSTHDMSVIHRYAPLTSFSLSSWGNLGAMEAAAPFLCPCRLTSLSVSFGHRWKIRCSPSLPYVPFLMDGPLSTNLSGASFPRPSLFLLSPLPSSPVLCVLFLALSCAATPSPSCIPYSQRFELPQFLG